MNKSEILSAFGDSLAAMGLEGCSVSADVDDGGIIRLSGEVAEWPRAVEIGHMAAKLPGVRNVVCDITAPESVERPRPDLAPMLARGVAARADVVIIGGGITGCAAARQLSKYKLDILLLEKGPDICSGTTKSNNGMIHSGYDSKPGSNKAVFNVKGNAMYTAWAEQLGFKFMRTGSFVVGYDDEDYAHIERFYANGVKNGVPGIEIISGERARELEPGLSEDVASALWTPSAGYVEPYEVALALAENAAANGARIMLDTAVYDVLTEGGAVRGVLTERGVIETPVVINAAGLYADEVAEMAGDRFFSIHARRGALVILDKVNRGRLHTYSGTCPKNYTKGGGPQATPEGTLLWGPSAEEIADKEDLSVLPEDIEAIIAKGMHITRGISPDTVITYFAGNRAASYNEDFIIENSKKVKGLIHEAGIQSPGLASAPAIAERLEELYLEQNPSAAPMEDYDPIRPARRPFRECSNEERAEMIARDPSYGRVICRCETVTEGEIVDAIHGPVPARTVDAIKRRTRAGMGRCQGGFCGPRVLAILARELGIRPSEVTLKGAGSEVLLRPTREAHGGER